MSFINSPNMSLPVPVVGNEPGPDYAKDVNNSLSLVDAHDHSPGKGVKITPTGLNINAALSLQTNFLTNAAGVTFTPQTVTPSIGTIYVNGVDLYYVDENNNNIRLTQNGGIAGTSGSIANLVAPASAAYVSGLSTFVWQSNTGIAANMDFGSATLRNLSPNSTFGLTLSPPAGLSSNYTITLPVLPSVPAFVSIDNAGNMSASPSLTKGITASMVADGTLTTTQISTTAGILGTQLSAAANILLGQLNSAVLQWNTTTITTSGTFTVPANVNRLNIIGVGGGGGGGGVSTSVGQTGGGGGGSTPMQYSIPVSPGDVLTASIGAGGGGGALNATGGTGGNTTLTYAGGQLLFLGATGGQGPSSGAGGLTYYVPQYAVGPVASGGSSVGVGSPGSAAVGTAYVGNPATGGAAAGGSQAGSGGGSGIGPGSNGTAAVNSAPCINAAAATNPGSGGGSSGASSVYVSGGQGGAGAPGAVVISWLGHP